MTDELPIACRLNGPELAGHLGRLAALGPSLIEAGRGPGVLTLRFAPDPAARVRVQAWLEVESRCCPFLDFDTDDAQDALSVIVRAPTDGAFVLDELHAALTAGLRPAPRR